MTRITGAEAKRLREAAGAQWDELTFREDVDHGARAIIAAAPSLALAVEELERERDEAIAELAVERGDARCALPGWRRDGHIEWSTESGGLVRHEGATDEHGCALWSWYADEADEGDPSQTAPTARAAMRAADAAAKARQS